MIIDNSKVESIVGDKYKEIETEYNSLKGQYQGIKKSDKYSEEYKEASRDHYIKEVMALKEKGNKELLEQLEELKEKAIEQGNDKPILKVEEEILKALQLNNQLIQVQALTKGTNHIQLKSLAEEFSEHSEMLKIIKGATQENISNEKDITENQALLRTIDQQIERNKENKLVKEIDSYIGTVKRQLIDQDKIYLGIEGAKALGLNIKEQFDYHLEKQADFFN